MFDVGFNELLLIAVIGLLVLGPERLPRVAAQLGRWVGRARRTATQLRHQLEREIALSEIAKAQRKQTEDQEQERIAESQQSADDGAAEAVPAPTHDDHAEPAVTDATHAAAGHGEPGESHERTDDSPSAQ